MDCAMNEAEDFSSPQTPAENSSARAAGIAGHGIEVIRQRLEAYSPAIEASQRSQRQAAVAMILREGEAGLESLFIKRAEHPLDPWSGHMAFPGGRRDSEQESLEGIAIRETLEEVGLELAPEMVIGRLDDLNGGRLRPHELSVSPFVFYHPEPPELTLNYEVDDVVWVPLDFMAEPGNVSTYLYPPDPQERPFPSFRVGPGYNVWGMTYRMVTHFMRVFDVRLPLEGDMTDVE
jgi:8-oxo-dGTP pyrophosphatase MutT (NUDIX family)